MLDPDGSLIPVFQMAYLWGFLVPFGWCAFVNLSPQRIAYLLLIASGLSCLVAIGQFTGYMPTLPTQKIIDYKDSSRAAGLVLQCNSLTMALTPCFLLLPHIRQASLRILMLLLLLGGIASTVSKSAIMIVPGLLFYFFWREPEKGRVLRWLVAASVVGLLVFNRGASVAELVDKLNAVVEFRLSNADSSLSDRAHLANVAFEHSDECMFLGYGTEGTYRVMMSKAGMGQTVHVFYLGLVLIEGWIALGLTMLGFHAAHVPLDAAKIQRRNFSRSTLVGDLGDDRVVPELSVLPVSDCRCRDRARSCRTLDNSTAWNDSQSTAADFRNHPTSCIACGVGWSTLGRLPVLRLRVHPPRKPTG